jgi:hypothetical protein
LILFHGPETSTHVEPGKFIPMKSLVHRFDRLWFFIGVRRCRQLNGYRGSSLMPTTREFLPIEEHDAAV